MNLDLRLAPAAVAAWLAAALAIHLATQWQWGIAAIGLIAVGIAAMRKRVAIVLVSAAVSGVGISASVQSSQMVTCEGSATVSGRALSDGVETAMGALFPARLSVRVEEIACNGGDGEHALGTIVLLGDVGDVSRNSTVRASGQMLEVPRGGDAYALLLDAELISAEPATGLVGAVAQRRADFLELTSRLSPQGQGLVPGMTFGDDSALTDAMDQAMKRTSLSHLTAISGSHITMMLAVILVLTMRASVRWRAVFLLLSLGALLLLVGPEASVIRAAAMATVAAVALAKGRPPQALPALATGIAVIMIVDPWRSTSLGFALSVAASAALVIVVPRLIRRAPEKRVWLRRAVAVMSVPLVAQLACSPIIVLFSPAVSLSSVLANVLVAPAVPVATGAGMLGLLSVQWEPVAMFFVRIAEAGTWWIATVAMNVSVLPGASLPWLGGAIGAVLLGAMSLAALVALAGPPVPRGRHAAPPMPWFRRAPSGATPGTPSPVVERAPVPVMLRGMTEKEVTRSRRMARWVRTHPRSVATFVSVVVLIAVWMMILRPSPWVVWQCDVGQGTASLIRSGPNRAVMVDVGLAEGRSQDCLTRARIMRLDLLVLTHPHSDHVGNLPAILAAVPVSEAIVSPVRTSTAERLDPEFATVGVAPSSGVAGSQGNAGGVAWTVLWPREGMEFDDGDDGPGVNDSSVVLLMETDGVRIIALGDLETAGQDGLTEQIRACGAPCQDVDIAVVAHHGSATQSAELARLLAPSIALIPVGENTYGHPAPETIALYESVGAVVLRTDTDGDIKVGNVGRP